MHGSKQLSMCGDICDRITWRMKVDPTFFVDRICVTEGSCPNLKLSLSVTEAPWVDCHVRLTAGLHSSGRRDGLQSGWAAPALGPLTRTYHAAAMACC